MHHRIIVSSEGQVDKTRVSFPIGNYTTLNDFAEKAVNIAVEWCTPIAASDFEVDYIGDTRHPKGLLLSLMNVRVHNQATSWPIETGSILALLPQYRDTGLYGVSQDSPYIQSSYLSFVSHGDDLRRLASLEFQLFSAGSLVDSVDLLEAHYMEDWSASLVFWTVEPERPLVTPYEHFNIWLSSHDRVSGTVADFTVNVDLTTFSMDEREIGAWNAAVSYVSPIEQLVLIAAEQTRGLLLTCPDLQTHMASDPVLALLSRSHIIGEETFFGYRRSIRGVCSDTVGLQLREAIDSRSSLRFKLLDATTLGTPINTTGLTEFTFCLTVYKVK